MHEDLKKWLMCYQDALNLTDDLTARRDALVLRAEAARTSSLDGMPHGKGGRVDPTGNMVTLIETLNVEISQKITEA